METEPKDISYPDSRSLLTPEAAWKLFTQGEGGNTNDFKITAYRIPFNQALLLCDVKIHKKFQEDKLFEGHPSYAYNLRRGLSFVIDINTCGPEFVKHMEDTAKEAQKHKDGKAIVERKRAKKKERRDGKHHAPSEKVEQKEEEEEKGSPMEEVMPVIEAKKVTPPVLPTIIPKVFMLGRRGLQKFFDVLPMYLEDPFKLPNNDNKANYLFWGAHKQLLAGAGIEMYATRKANGENAQVAYLPDLDAWCIGSKNVSICIRDEKDLPYYEQG